MLEYQQIVKGSTIPPDVLRQQIDTSIKPNFFLLQKHLFLDNPITIVGSWHDSNATPPLFTIYVIVKPYLLWLFALLDPLRSQRHINASCRSFFFFWRFFFCSLTFFDTNAKISSPFPYLNHDDSRHWDFVGIFWPKMVRTYYTFNTSNSYRCQSSCRLCIGFIGPFFVSTTTATT